MKKKSISLILVLTLVISLGTLAWAGNSDTIIVNYSTSEINELSTSGSATLDVSAATPGSSPDSVTDDTTNYSITTNDDASNQKITAELNSVITETGVTLEINVDAPSGSGTSQNYKDITSVTSAAPVDVVTSIATEAQSTIGISFRLFATVNTGILGSNLSKTCTLTLINTGA